MRLASISKTTLNDLRAVKQRVQDRVAGHPNVAGWMIAAKIKGGRIVRTNGVTVIVHKKVPKADLSSRERIPASVTFKKRKYLIDVLESGPQIKQSGTTFPMGSGLLISDGADVGTISALCRSQFGFFGMSCAHALGGPDHDPTTPSPINVWSPILKRYEAAGQSVLAVASPGAGIPGQFGFMDAGLFTLGNPELVTRARSASALRTTNVVQLRQRLVGYGAMSADQRSGQIIGIEAEIGQIRTDLVIQVSGAGTFPGDSGMLWLNAGGEAVAIHTYGEQQGPGVGSAVTLSMMASRATEALSVELVAF